MTEVERLLLCAFIGLAFGVVSGFLVGRALFTMPLPWDPKDPEACDDAPTLCSRHGYAGFRPCPTCAKEPAPKA